MAFGYKYFQETGGTGEVVLRKIVFISSQKFMNVKISSGEVGQKVKFQFLKLTQNNS